MSPDGLEAAADGPWEVRDRKLRGSFASGRAALVALTALEAEEPDNTELVILGPG